MRLYEAVNCETRTCEREKNNQFGILDSDYWRQTDQTHKCTKQEQNYNDLFTQGLRVCVCVCVCVSVLLWMNEKQKEMKRSAE